MVKQVLKGKNKDLKNRTESGTKLKEIFSKVNIDNLKSSFGKYGRVFIALICLLIMAVKVNVDILTTIFGYPNTLLGYNPNYERVADPNTMENYLKEDVLGLDKSSRHAGRIWSDKTVFASGYIDEYSGLFDGTTLQLDKSNDGTNAKIKSNTDFLHVFSTIGSSQVLNQSVSQPLDVVLLLDISSSMTDTTAGNNGSNDPLHQVLIEANTLIDQLMGNDPDHKVNAGNRVGVVVYGGGTQELLPLDHYTGNGSDEYKYMFVSGRTVRGQESTSTTYFPAITSIVESTYKSEGFGNFKNNKTSGFMVADSTYLQGALYTGMKMLSEEKTTKYLNYNRVPVLIILTDGATNIVSTTETSDGGEDTYEWYEPFEGVVPPDEGNQYAHPGGNPFYASCNSGTTNNTLQQEAIVGRSVSNLLLAGYYKNKIEKNYNNTDMLVHSIGFNTQDTGVGEYGREQLAATLDPTTYFSSLSRDNSRMNQLRTKIRDLLTDYISNSNSGNATKLRFPENRDQNFEWVKDGLSANFTWNHPEDTENDIKSFSDIEYVNKYHVAEDADDIGSVFGDIFDEITGSKFNPIDGENDAGVNDTLVYMDPIGEYMEVKDKGVDLDGKTYDLAMTLFEKNYGLVKTAVYDYNFNVSQRGNYLGLENAQYSNEFLEGWYKTDDDGKVELVGYYEKDEDGNNTIYHAVKQIDGVPSFDAGYTYYANVATARQYISTLSGEGTDDITTKEKNTVYTMYRIDDDSRNTDVLNPCYEKSANVNYRLSDIRVWKEETDDYEDDDSGSVINNGYDDALYINIPKNALPILTANISIDTDDNVNYQMDLEFKSNMGDESNSEHPTPFRLFYGVGVSDDIMSADGLDIDISKLSNEYISSHTINDGIYFLSNWYSNTEYNDTVEVTSDTANLNRGDSNVTFSPAGDNRYYSFQNPLVIYKPLVDGDTITKDTEVDLSDKDDYNSFLKAHENSVITDPINELDPDNWYVIIIDYYVKDDEESGQGRVVHLAVTRKGSEFGVVKDNGSFSNPGEYLTWYNIDGNNIISSENIRPYDSGHMNQPDEDGTWVLATKVGGLRVGNLAKMFVNKNPRIVDESARTVYVPTISSNTNGENTIVNIYLGNNGRLVIPNKILQVTKEVESEGGEVDPDKEFKFEVTIDNYTGDHEAIVLIKNPFSNAYQLRLNSIDIVTDNRGLLQTETYTSGGVEHQRSVTTISRNGVDYYIYIGGSASEDETGNSYPLFRANSDTGDVENLEGVGRNIYVSEKDLSTYESASTDNTKYLRETGNHPAGSIEYWVDKAYLVPKDTVDKGEWTFDLEARYQVENRFVISTLDSNLTGANELSSNYVTRSSYLTRTLYFGYDLDEGVPDRPEGISDDDWNWMTNSANKFKAQFTLKDGEGLEFTGIGDNESYDIKEVLTTDEEDEGYFFDRVEEEEGNVVDSVEVNGIVDSRQEEHYFNGYRAHYDITLDKTVLGTFGDTDKPWLFEIKLTPPTNPDTGEVEELKEVYRYYGPCKEIDETCTAVKHEMQMTKNDDGTYTGTISLKHNQKVKIINILYNTKYEITEVEADQNGYETEVKDGIYAEDEYYDENTGIMDKDKQVGFVNVNWATHNLGIRKMVNGSGGERNREFTFVITLTPGEYVNIAPSYNYDGSKEGTIDFTTNDNGKTYTGTITLKHNEHITIHDIPENTRYKVAESEANKDGYITVPSNAEGELKGDEEIEVQYVNTKYSNHELTIEKIIRGSSAIEADSNKEWEFKVTLTPEEDIIMATEYPYEGKSIVDGVEKPADGTITFTSVDDGKTYVGTVKVKHGQAITIKGIPERVQYQVEEVEANKNDYTTTASNNTNGIVDGQTVRFTNTKLADVNLTISKEVINSTGLTTDQKNLEWEFDIDLIPVSGITLENQYNYTGGVIDGIEGVTAPENGHIDLTNNNDGTYSGKITLKHGQSITINGLPELTKYVVKEVKANRDGYFTSSTNNRSGVLNGDVTVTFKNELLPPDSLTIAKEVQGSAGDLDKEWTFDIKLHPVDPSDFATEYSYVGRTTLDGVDKPTDGTLTFEQQEDDWYLATITLKSGQAITINDIPTGTQFEVIEREANSDGYHTSTNYSTDSASVTGTIEEDSVANIVLYTNVKTVNYNLTLSKRVLGALGDKNRLWNFSIRLTPSEYDVIEEQYSYDGSKTGVLKFDRQDDGSYIAEIDLKSSESITIRGISENTRYEIVEREANSEDYITRTVGDATGILDENRSVTFENIKLGSFDLTIKKYVKGNMGEKTRDFTFRITLVAPELKDLESRYVGTKTSVVYEDGHSETKEEEFTLELVMNENGNYEGYIKLKDNETFTIEGLPEGTKYMITETDADDYITTYTPNAQGTIVDNGTVVEFTNYKYRAVRLTIEKRLKGNNVELNRNWNFEVTLSYDDEMPLNGIFPYVKSNKETGFVEFTKGLDGTYRSIVVLRGGEKITIQNLPYNVEYAVREIEANKDRYETTATNENGTLIDDDTLVLFVNRRDEPNPSTGDRFTTYLSMFIISTVSVAGTFLVRRKVSE